MCNKFVEEMESILKKCEIILFFSITTFKCILSNFFFSSLALNIAFLLGTVSNILFTIFHYILATYDVVVFFLHFYKLGIIRFMVTNQLVICPANNLRVWGFVDLSDFQGMYGLTRYSTTVREEQSASIQRPLLLYITLSSLS